MYVSIIIPVWNNWQYTRACLASLAQFDDARMEVLVVDNGSTDDTRDFLDTYGKKLFQNRFACVRHERNLGFAIACNAGAQASSGEVLFFLNNDTTVTENWLSPLLETLAMPNIVASGPLLLYPDGTCQHCGVSFTPLRNPFHLYANFPGNHPALRSKHPLQAITGAALMVRKADFFAAGQFNPEYRNGFEDLDLCCCLRQHGGELAIAPKSIIIHHESKTPGRHDDDYHNASLFTQRWEDFIQADLHKQVAVDGFQVCLGPNLESYIEQTKKSDFTSDLTIGEVGERINREPLWLDGHLMFIKFLTESGDYAEAYTRAEQLTWRFPIDKVYRTALRCAQKLQRKDYEKAILNKLSRDWATTQKNRKKILFFKEKAIKMNDSELVDIYSRWLRTYG